MGWAGWRALEQATRLITDSTSDPTRSVCGLLLKAAITGSPQKSPFRLPVSVLADTPQLCALLAPAGFDEESVASGIGHRAFNEPWLLRAF